VISIGLSTRTAAGNVEDVPFLLGDAFRKSNLTEAGLHA
jgi:hypothetical protein